MKMSKIYCISFEAVLGVIESNITAYCLRNILTRETITETFLILKI